MKEISKNKKTENMLVGGGKNVDVVREKDWYKEKIIDMVNQVQNLEYLKFIYNTIVSFKKKWGI